jgi:hypothetical protein
MLPLLSGVFSAKETILNGWPEFSTQTIEDSIKQFPSYSRFIKTSCTVMASLRTRSGDKSPDSRELNTKQTAYDRFAKNEKTNKPLMFYPGKLSLLLL